MLASAHLALLLAAFAQTASSTTPPPTIHTWQPKKFRFISLAEARAIALEQGTIGQPSLLCHGQGLDNYITGIHVLASLKPGSKSLVVTGVSRKPRPADSERSINQMLLNIENAYWNLYGSYWQLHSREQGLRLAYETCKVTRRLHDHERVSCAAVAQAEGQYNLFRSQYLQALDTVLDNERQLRAMLGMKIEQHVRLIPSDAPSLVEQKPDWKEGLDSALQNRPELYLARRDVKKMRAKLEETKNSGIRQASAVDTAEPATPVRQAQLQLARANLVLQDQELKAERFLGLYYRRMSSAYFQIKAARAQREAFATQMKVRYELLRNGSNEPGTDSSVNLLLESQRFWTEALATEYQAITTYNNALAGWDYAKGTIMKHARVRFGTEPAEKSKIVRAVEREQKRTQHHVRCESALPADVDCLTGSEAKAPSLVVLWKCCPPLAIASELPTLAGDLSEGPIDAVLVNWKVSEIFPPYRHHGDNGKP
jgi:hypothetical protein